MINAVHVHKHGIIFSYFSISFQKKKKVKELRPRLTKIASGGGGVAHFPPTSFSFETRSFPE